MSQEEVDWSAIASILSNRLPSPVVVIDRVGHIRMVNEPMEDLLGRSRFELQSLHWRDACTPDDHRDDTDRWIAEALRGTLRNHSVMAIRRDGSRLGLHLELTPLGRADEQSVLATATPISTFSTAQVVTALGEVDYDLAHDQRFTLTRLVVDGRVIHFGPPSEQRCFEILHGREAPCPDCPLLAAGPWPKLVTRRRAATEVRAAHYEVTTAYQTLAGPRFRMRMVPDQMVEAIQTARVEQLVTRANLSAREREILSYLLLGRSLEDIAMLSGLSVRTVKYHQAHVLEKLGADSRADLTRFLL